MKKKKKRIEDPFDAFLGLDDYFDSMRKMMERMMHSMMNIEEDRIEKLMKDPNTKVYGLSVKIGPDGKPIVKEFGNIKPSIEAIEEGKEELIGAREPLTEIQRHGKEIVIIAEIPGVSKNDIKLIAYDDKLEIKVDTENRKYYKKLSLPAYIDEKSIKASYKNGILEVKLKVKKEKEKKGKVIKVE